MRLLCPSAGHCPDGTGYPAFPLRADSNETHLSASQGVATVATRGTASTALRHDHTPAWQSLLTAREATGEGPHTTCRLLPSTRDVGPATTAQCLAVATRSKQAGSEGTSQTANTDESVGTRKHRPARHSTAPHQGGPGPERAHQS